ncbi:ribosomal protection-like ABC-F family protein [uncultured Finegoldia sp.]|uniref:ribosomal protection-like ABC-F family protein n=1 Tax=uncultured Finegoldia sp. TaxID=328009 RepID=UPI002616034A|nr:ABC-F family ATP-binding cassette domain-containing protein [uncultured Finegoldia sp.]
MILIGAKDLEKSFLDKRILEKVTFNINDNDKIGIIGINGAGKSTLFNILTGELSKDGGDLFIKNDIKIGYLTQHNTFNSQNTLYEECLSVFSEVLRLENKLREYEKQMKDTDELEELMNKYHRDMEKFEAMGGYLYDSEIRGTLKGLGFAEDDFEKNVTNFSGGQKSRIMLAKLLLQKCDLLLLDEPTNHLDINAIEFLENFLKNYKGACVIISHDRYFLDGIVNRIFHLEKATIKTYETDYTGFMKQRKIYMDIQKKTYENQQREYKRQLEIVEKYTNTDNAKKNRQGQSRKKLLDKMKLMDKPTYDDGTFGIKFKISSPSGKDVLIVEELKKEIDDRLIFENCNINIYKEERVGLIGANGVGKTTLFNIITNKLKQTSGKFKLGSNVHIGYFDQEQMYLNDKNTIIDEIWDEYPKMTHYEIRSALAIMNFVGDDIFKLIEELSGGEKARVSLLKLMLSNSNFLLLDEPTNHLDIDSKESLEDSLINYEGTVFVISHDRYFLNRVCDKIIVLESDKTTTYLGNYDYYQEKLNDLKKEEQEENLNKTAFNKEKKKKRAITNNLKKLRKEIETIESKIDEIDDRIKEIENIFCQNDVYDDSKKVIQLNEELETLNQDKNSLYSDWEQKQLEYEDFDKN